MGQIKFHYNEAGKPQPVVFEQIFAEKPGGGMVNAPAGVNFVPAGTGVTNDSNGGLMVIPFARVYEAANSGATSVKVNKGTTLIVGNNYTLGSVSIKVKSIDYSNANYDLLVLNAAASASIAANSIATTDVEKAIYVTGNDVYTEDGQTAFEVRLINGANLRKETANVAPQFAPVGVTLV